MDTHQRLRLCTSTAISMQDLALGCWSRSDGLQVITPCYSLYLNIFWY